MRSGGPRGGGLMRLVGVSSTRRGEPVRLGKGGIELESLFLVTLTCPPYARGRRLSKTQKTHCTKCTKKTQNTQCTRCTKGGRWKMGGGHGRLAAGSRMASHPLHRQAYGEQASPLSIGWRDGEREKRDCASASCSDKDRLERKHFRPSWGDRQNRKWSRLLLGWQGLAGGQRLRPEVDEDQLFLNQMLSHSKPPQCCARVSRLDLRVESKGEFWTHWAASVGDLRVHTVKTLAT